MHAGNFYQFPVKMTAVVITKVAWVRILVGSIGRECGPGPQDRKIAFRVNPDNAVEVAVDEEILYALSDRLFFNHYQLSFVAITFAHSL